MRAARERAGLFEIEAIVGGVNISLWDARCILKRRSARPYQRLDGEPSGNGPNTGVPRARHTLRVWIADCELTYSRQRLPEGTAEALMELSIKSHGLDLSDPLKAYTARRLRFSLGPFVTQLDGVEVRLGDINGPRGGIDKTVAVKVILRRFGVVFARAAGHDVYSTVDHAAARIRSAISRTLGRRRARR